MDVGNLPRGLVLHAFAGGRPEADAGHQNMSPFAGDLVSHAVTVMVKAGSPRVGKAAHLKGWHDKRAFASEILHQLCGIPLRSFIGKAKFPPGGRCELDLPKAHALYLRRGIPRSARIPSSGKEGSPARRSETIRSASS